jgi:hypothetical protein
MTMDGRYNLRSQLGYYAIVQPARSSLWNVVYLSASSFLLFEVIFISVVVIFA